MQRLAHIVQHPTLMRTMSLVLLVALASACARAEAARQPVQVEMKNVDLHVTPDVVLHIRQLRGQFVPVAGRQLPDLDAKQSYTVAVDSGEIAMDIGSLNALMTRTLGGERSNVDKLRLSIEDGVMKQKGVIDSAINIPFTSKSTVAATPDGRIRITTKSVKGFGIPMKPFMKVFGLKMDEMVKVEPGHGVVTDGNDLILNPAELLPPPSIRGTVTAARIEGNNLVQTFGAARARPFSGRATAKNYIYWRGSYLSFGKLTMEETDLELIDRDPKDPFDFSVEHWNDQLVAGYSKTLANRGLKAYMPDYNDLKGR
jgi:hypothetical protein